MCTDKKGAVLQAQRTAACASSSAEGRGGSVSPGRPTSDYIRQAAIDLVPVYPWSLISINSSLEELARDPS